VRHSVTVQWLQMEVQATAPSSSPVLYCIPLRSAHSVHWNLCCYESFGLVGIVHSCMGKLIDWYMGLEPLGPDAPRP
jgi:hypothetical protein